MAGTAEAELAAADAEILGRDVAALEEVPEALVLVATRAVVVGVKTAVTFSLEAAGEKATSQLQRYLGR